MSHVCNMRMLNLIDKLGLSTEVCYRNTEGFVMRLFCLHTVAASVVLGLIGATATAQVISNPEKLSVNSNVRYVSYRHLSRKNKSEFVFHRGIEAILKQFRDSSGANAALGAARRFAALHIEQSFEFTIKEVPLATGVDVVQLADLPAAFWITPYVVFAGVSDHGAGQVHIIVSDVQLVVDGASEVAIIGEEPLLPIPAHCWRTSVLPTLRRNAEPAATEKLARYIDCVPNPLRKSFSKWIAEFRSRSKPMELRSCWEMYAPYYEELTFDLLQLLQFRDGRTIFPPGDLWIPVVSDFRKSINCL